MKEIVGNEVERPLSAKEEYVLDLLYLRDNWEKNEGVRSYSQKDGHAQWFLSIAANTENALTDEILSEKGSQLAKDYLSWYADNFDEFEYVYPIVDDPQQIEHGKMFIEMMISSFYPDPVELESYDSKNLVDHLSYLKLFFDGIPNKMVHSGDGPWKIRTNWFLGVVSDIENALEDRLLSSQPENKARIFLEWWREWGEKNRALEEVINTQEYLDVGNQIINDVLESLEASKT